jgi:excisionase family DNA binding protein
MMRYYTTQQVARMLNTDVQIVRHKCREGHIPAIRPPGFRDWRIPVADLEKLLWDLEEEARNKKEPVTQAGPPQTLVTG